MKKWENVNVANIEEEILQIKPGSRTARIAERNYILKDGWEEMSKEELVHYFMEHQVEDWMKTVTGVEMPYSHPPRTRLVTASFFRMVRDEVEKTINQIELVRKKDGSPLMTSKSVNGQPVVSPVVKIPCWEKNFNLDRMPAKAELRDKYLVKALHNVLSKLLDDDNSIDPLSKKVYKKTLDRMISNTTSVINRNCVIEQPNSEYVNKILLSWRLGIISVGNFDSCLKSRIANILVDVKDVKPSTKAVAHAEKQLRLKVREFLYANHFTFETLPAVEQEVAKHLVKRIRSL